MSNPSRANALATLLDLYSKPEVKNVWFNAKEIKLDGYTFRNCRFDNCKLQITSTNFELDSCFIDPTTTIIFGTEIAKPIRIYNVHNDWVYEKLPFFAPQKNSDGTISIK